MGILKVVYEDDSIEDVDIKSLSPSEWTHASHVIMTGIHQLGKCKGRVACYFFARAKKPVFRDLAEPPAEKEVAPEPPKEPERKETTEPDIPEGNIPPWVEPEWPEFVASYQFMSKDRKGHIVWGQYKFKAPNRTVALRWARENHDFEDMAYNDAMEKVNEVDFIVNDIEVYRATEMK